MEERQKEKEETTHKNIMQSLTEPLSAKKGV